MIPSQNSMYEECFLIFENHNVHIEYRVKAHLQEYVTLSNFPINLGQKIKINQLIYHTIMLNLEK